MKIQRNSFKILCIWQFLVWLLIVPASAEQLYAPQFLWDKGIADKTDPVAIADTHLGIPYRDDGALDDKGRFTTFDDPGRFFDTPGLNCSGLVVSVSRFLFNKNWTLEEVTRDRLNDSGDNSPNGKDWDFGFDLVLNITEGYSPRILMPDGKNYPVAEQTGLTMRGFDLHDAEAWSQLIPAMKPGHVYLGSISKPGTARGYKVMHYHVVLMLPDANGDVWLYHATRRSQVHKMNIRSQQGLGRLFSQFKSTKADTKKIFIVEAKLPVLTISDSPQDSGPPQSVGSEQVMESGRQDTSQLPSETQAAPPVTTPAPAPVEDPKIVLNHLTGKVFNANHDVTTSIPKLILEGDANVRFTFTNRGNVPRNLSIMLQGPNGKLEYKGSLPEKRIVHILYPRDFGAGSGPLKMGQYLSDIRIDGKQWLANVFEVGEPHEAQPKIAAVKVPSVVPAGKTFELRVEAINEGAESDYGGITVSSPDPSGIKIVGAKPGKVFSPGSTVLAVTSDRIRTKVPMAERWIELWGEKKVYDMTVQFQASRPGTYHIFVRSALRGVNVKSNVVLMDPQKSGTVDQQGFPVYVYEITVK